MALPENVIFAILKVEVKNWKFGVCAFYIKPYYNELFIQTA